MNDCTEYFQCTGTIGSYVENNDINNNICINNILARGEIPKHKVTLHVDDIYCDDKIYNDDLSNKLKKLEERIEKLEKFINDMIFYAPGNEGYEEAKSDFDIRRVHNV